MQKGPNTWKTTTFAAKRARRMYERTSGHAEDQRRARRSARRSANRELRNTGESLFSPIPLG